jgi:hypothetical protein
MLKGRSYRAIAGYAYLLEKLAVDRQARLSSATMKRSVNVALAMFTATFTAVAPVAAVAHADPVVPEPGVACGGSAGVMDGVQTFSPQHEVLECVKGSPKFVWQHLDDIQRPAVAWFTYGPAATLTKSDVIEGTRWTGFERGANCSEEQTHIAGGAPARQAATGDDTLDFTVVPDMATMTLHGVCIWREDD